MPAICNLDASFFEPGSRQDERFWEVGAEGASEYRFPGDEARRVLAQSAVGKDGARTHRYAREGRAVMVFGPRPTQTTATLGW